MWKLDGLDFSVSHQYTSTTLPFEGLIKEFQAKYGKPHIIGEFSNEWYGSSDEEHHLFEVHFHNGLWRGLFSPTPILPLSWWWRSHEKHGNYKHLEIVSNFSRQMLISNQPLVPLTEEKIYVTYRSKGRTDGLEGREALVITAVQGWGPNRDVIFTIEETGMVTNMASVPSFVYGYQKKEYRNSPVFEVEFKKEGEFFVHVNRVSEQNTLRIWLNDEIALEKFLPLGPGEGEWESSEFVSKYGVYHGVYNRTFSIPIPAGVHTIRVENCAEDERADWINITEYGFRNIAILRDAPPIGIMSLKAGRDIFFWLYNPLREAAIIKRRGMPESINDVALGIENLKPGKYSIELYDTCKGIFFEKIEILVDEQNRRLSLDLPDLQKDMAGRIRLLSK